MVKAIFLASLSFACSETSTTLIFRGSKDLTGGISDMTNNFLNKNLSGSFFPLFKVFCNTDSAPNHVK